eukprot:gnl/TRDRNA2_/TRDRNA2_40946_c0_seq1.p1 gnl/TRDRNA2_/TRDRNA2_40946_c0~~gnl/TRDRNA2_/TRDRNA2_40946_c0_seq1.p1  ORF type:complete len:216 (-),score=17.79 gnl/TRDRNA2_/TRDRNA2_40946_c0_seq1:47-694(-)
MSRRDLTSREVQKLRLTAGDSSPATSSGNTSTSAPGSTAATGQRLQQSQSQSDIFSTFGLPSWSTWQEFAEGWQSSGSKDEPSELTYHYRYHNSKVDFYDVDDASLPLERQYGFHTQPSLCPCVGGGDRFDVTLPATEEGAVSWPPEPTSLAQTNALFGIVDDRPPAWESWLRQPDVSKRAPLSTPSTLCPAPPLLPPPVAPMSSVQPIRPEAAT